jgi:hypothetical protein
VLNRRSNSTTRTESKTTANRDLTNTQIDRKTKTADEFEPIEGYTILTDPDPTISSYCRSSNQMKNKPRIRYLMNKIAIAGQEELDVELQAGKARADVPG